MDTLFKALADPTRLALLDRLKSQDGQTLQDLQGQLDMTRFGVMKHLTVLEEAGLIVTKKVGRFKHHYLNALPLQEAIDHWIEPYRVKPMARAVLDLKSRLEAETDAMPDPDLTTHIFIRGTAASVFHALRNPDALAAYHPDASRVLRDGDTLTYYGADGGHLMMCTETERTAPTRLAMTFAPLWAPNIAPSHVVITLADQGEHCCVTVDHFDLTEPPRAMALHWGRVLSGLKTWLETDQPTKFSSAAE